MGHPVVVGSPSETIELARWRFTVADYHRMGEVGILDEDDRVELIDGEVVRMSPIGWKHRWLVENLNHLLFTQIGHTTIISVQNPVQLSEHDEPQPDLMVLRRVEGGYRRHLVATDVLLLIEVADETLARDRNVKLPRYAAAGIPETWILNVRTETVERHADPREGRYQHHQIYARGEIVQARSVSLALAVDAIFG